MSEMLQKIRSRGYWKVVVHPFTFDEERIAKRSDLLPLLKKSSVRIKGWSFPHVDDYIPTEEGEYWVGQEIDLGDIVELWRFYQCGQFVHYSGMLTDWRKYSSTFSGWPSQWHDGKTGELKVLLDIKEVIIRFAEAFEFAARLSSTPAGDDFMHLEIEVGGIEDHYLRVSQNLELDRFREMINPAHKVSFEFDVPLIELKASARELALKPTVELFSRFGWNPGKSYIRDIQREVLSPVLIWAGWV